MKNCQRCGHAFKKPEAQFCGECGHNNSWQDAELDLPEEVKKYATALHHLFFDPSNTDEAINKYALDLRGRLKISFELHETVIAKFTSRRAAIAQMMGLRIEFDENVSDAFAGHDSHLRFRITNPHGNVEIFKATLEWDDPETPNPVDFRAMTNSFVKPGQTQEIAGTHVFMRAGPKQIQQMTLTVENQFFDQCRFLVSPFSFRVGSFQQQVVNNITTHNQISIEGRGVVDASNMGGAAPGASPDGLPRWRVLPFTLAPEASLLEGFAKGHAITSKGPSAAVAPAVPASAPAAAVAQVAGTSSSAFGAEAADLSEPVDRLFQQLEGLVAQHSPGEQARLISSTKLDLTSLEEVGAYIGEAGPHLVYGFVVADASSVAMDDSGLVTGFGDAIVISQSGVSVIMNSAERQHESRFYEWNQLEPNGISFYGQKFGPKGFLLFFGDPNSRSFLPGCRFDFRRYQGAQPMDEVVALLQGQLDEIKLFAPLSESTQPRAIGVSQSKPVETTQSSAPAVPEAPQVEEDSWDALVREAIKTGQEIKFDNGDHYVGAVVNNQMHGFGVYTWSPNGESAGLRYEGDTYGGWLHGSGLLNYPDGRIENIVFRFGKYLGEVSTLNYPDGSEYNGTVEDGVAHGFGTLHYPDGTMYRGDFKHGERHGMGVSYDDEGNNTEVVCVEDEFKGYAELFNYSDGSCYVGTLVDGKPQGFGMVRFTNGDYVFGKLTAQGTCHGILDYYNSDGTSFEAVYCNGNILGAAETLYFESGDQFIGIVENGIAEKFGEYTFSDSGPYAGHVYEGEFKSGQFNGMGVYSFPDGSTLAGNFINGKYDDGTGGNDTSSGANQKKGFWKTFKEGFKEGYKSSSQSIAGEK